MPKKRKKESSEPVVANKTRRLVIGGDVVSHRKPQHHQKSTIQSLSCAGKCSGGSRGALKCRSIDSLRQTKKSKEAQGGRDGSKSQEFNGLETQGKKIGCAKKRKEREPRGIGEQGKKNGASRRIFRSKSGVRAQVEIEN